MGAKYLPFAQNGQIPYEQGEEGRARETVGLRSVGDEKDARRSSRETPITRFQGIEHGATAPAAEEDEIGPAPDEFIASDENTQMSEKKTGGQPVKERPSTRPPIEIPHKPARPGQVIGDSMPPDIKVSNTVPPPPQPKRTK